MGTNFIKVTRLVCMRYKYKIHTLVPPFKPSNEPIKRAYATATALNKEVLSGRLQVTVTSREMIKPSSPTPRHMNTVNLSILDQLAPSYHNPMILFYQNDYSRNKYIDHYKRSMSLKNSLSETLVHFYPLAGRTHCNVSIDCNDQGVEFCEADVNEDLTNVLENLHMEELRELLPFQARPRHKNIILCVQVNHFSCGGMAISICISHKIADGLGSIEFLRAWSTMAREGNNRFHVHSTRRPVFNGASYFPPLVEFNELCPQDSNNHDEKLVSRRLIFDKMKLRELKSQVNNNNIFIKEPTRVELVSSYLWKLVMTKIPGISASVHAVNLRTRATPPIPDECFGNFVLLSSTSCLSNGGQREYPELISEVRKAIKKIDNNYLERLLKSDQRLLEVTVNENDNINHGDGKCCFTSLCNFPLYEVDFGMGKPIWACHAASPVKNLVVLWSTKCGQGIEAWIHMLEDDMLALDFQESW